MKVICINNNGAPELSEGHPYEVSECKWAIDAYTLEARPVDPADGLNVAYYMWRFIPCSEIDETELVNERKPETVTVTA